MEYIVSHGMAWRGMACKEVHHQDFLFIYFAAKNQEQRETTPG